MKKEGLIPPDFKEKIPKIMAYHAAKAAVFILKLHTETTDSEVMVESRVYLDFIHSEMFGTFDGAVVDHFGILHVFDFKYGAGHSVSPIDNLQMIFYGLGLAAKFDWNFSFVRLWIIQPRIKGYNGPVYWQLDIEELRGYIPFFKRAVKKVEKQPEPILREGSWCHWCKAKKKCPLKQEKKLEKAKSIFASQPLLGDELDFGKEKFNGEEKSDKEESCFEENFQGFDATKGDFY